MPNENPGAYAENERRKKKSSLESERDTRQDTERFYEAQKMRVSKNTARYNLLSLKEKIKTGSSLGELKDIVRAARASGELSDEDFRTAEKMISGLDKEDPVFGEIADTTDIDSTRFPFSDTAFVKRLEASTLGEDIVQDIVGFAYGFFVQGGFILGYIGLKLIFDAISLPRDIYTLIKSN